MTPSSRDGSTVLVWDAPVRIAHWLIVLCGVGAYLTQKLEGDYFRYHVWFGYTMIVLVVARVVWGFVGPRHARFASFVRGPRAMLGYARALWSGARQPHAGHNPLGAVMVLLLLALLLAQGITGLFANDEVFEVGPLFGYVSASLSDRLTGWHERLFDWLLVAAVLHVLAVLAHLLVRRENLIAPMITGRKPHDMVPPGEAAIRGSSPWLAVAIVAAVAAVLAWIVSTAPEASLSFF